MKAQLIEQMLCLTCQQSDWKLVADSEDRGEIREGRLVCRHCERVYPIEKGILNAIGDLPKEVAHEKEHSETADYIQTADGEKWLINEKTIEQFRSLFLNLPAGDGSYHFQPGGSFDNQAGNAERFFKTLRMLQLTGKERVLEVGASFGWASRHFARAGCEVVAMDVTHFLQVADIYMEEDNTHFNRLMGDMSALPFKDGTFDIIFSHSVIHHCKDLKKLFAEFARVLKPKGRAVALHECAFGLLEDKSGSALQEAIEEGFNENAYTIPEWIQGARQGGFRKVKIHFFSFVDDYIFRKKSRGAKSTFKLKAAQWIQDRPKLNRFLNALSYWPRIILRPKAWMIVAAK